MIRGMAWLGIAYLFGILGFGLAELGDQWGGNDLGAMLFESFVAGLQWPLTVFDVLTGNVKH